MAHPKRHLWLVIITRAAVSIVVLAVGVGVFAMLFLSRPKPPDPRTDIAPPTVAVMRVADIPIERQWVGYGTARALVSAEVASELSAVIANLDRERIAVGRSIRAGEPILKLREIDYKRQLDLAEKRLADITTQIDQMNREKAGVEAQLNLAREESAIAQRDVDRVRDLMRNEGARQLELDQAMTRLTAAKRIEEQLTDQLNQWQPRRDRLDTQQEILSVERDMAQTNVDRTTIESPITGIIASVHVEQGEHVMAGKLVARIVGLDVIETAVRLPSQARPDVAIGDSVTLTPANRAASASDLTATGRSWNGRITRFSPDDDAATRTFAAFVEIRQSSESDRKLLAPGTFVAATVISSTPERRTIVPRAAVRDEAVLVVEDNRLARRHVEVDYFIRRSLPALALPGEEYWAVLRTSLEPGTLVALNGAIDIAVGTKVSADCMNDGRDRATAKDLQP
ncbi:MAG: efflux RND transporter periplasmic adaptor subunit [Phycisphaerales bacterium]